MKTVERKFRGFESYLLRQYNVCTAVSQVGFEAERTLPVAEMRTIVRDSERRGAYAGASEDWRRSGRIHLLRQYNVCSGFKAGQALTCMKNWVDLFTGLPDYTEFLFVGIRRGDREADGGALLRRCTGNRTEGSNPSFSAIPLLRSSQRGLKCGY